MRWRCATRWSRSTGQARHRASSTRPRSTRRTAPRIDGARGIGHGEGPADPRRAARDASAAGADRRACGRAVRAGRRGGRRAADPGLPLPPDRSAAWPRPRPGGPINIKKGQFLAPWDMKQRRRARSRRPATATSCSASAAPASATTRWSPTCAACRSWPRPAVPVVFDATHSVQQPGGQGDRPAAASASSCRCWRAPRSPSASPRSSWRPIRIPTTRRPTGRTWSASRTCRRCSPACWPSTAWPRRTSGLMLLDHLPRWRATMPGRTIGSMPPAPS